MNIARRFRSKAGSARTEAPTHLFKVGQTVTLKSEFGRRASPTDIYQITATLPPHGGSPQYRIRNDDEGHERVATQDSLEQADSSQPGSDATLIERTFGDGQGKKTQQSRDQKAEEGKASAQD